MLDAARLADEGVPHLSCVVADQQTEGQGRHGHSWESPRGGLYCTVVLRPRQTVPLMTLALGLAVAQAVQIPCDLRWPNDVMVGHKKLAGILCSLHGEALLAGIGVNLADPGVPDTAWLSGVSRDELLDRVLAEVAHFVELTPVEILRLFERASSYTTGRRVSVGVDTGITAGLTPDGFLLLRKDDGELVKIIAGGVRPA